MLKNPHGITFVRFFRSSCSACCTYKNSGCCAGTALRYRPQAMSMPTFAFLDTSIFDGQKYNFASTAFSTFAPACKKRAVKLLLPDPTEREIQRHLREKSQEAVEALEAAIKLAP